MSESEPVAKFVDYRPPQCRATFEGYRSCTRPLNHKGEHRHDTVFSRKSRASHFRYWEETKIALDEPLERTRSARFNQFLVELAGKPPYGEVHLHAFYFGRSRVKWTIATRPSVVCKVAGRCFRATVSEDVFDEAHV